MYQENNPNNPSDAGNLWGSVKTNMQIMVIAKDKLNPSFLYNFLAQQEKANVFYPHSSFICLVFLV